MFRMITLTCVVFAGCGGITTKLCGLPSQPCCAGETCDPGGFCGANGTCQPCGGEQQSCCDGTTCAGTLVCSNGVCTAPLSCEVNCTLGSQRCNENGVQQCSPQGVCPGWVTTVVQCPSGALCTANGSSADCVEQCPGACSIDALLCTVDGLRKCVAGAGTCPELQSERDETDRPRCTSGATVSAELTWESPTPFGSPVRVITGDREDNYFLLDDLGNVVHSALGVWEYEVRAQKGRALLSIASCGLVSLAYGVGTGGLVMRRSGGEWSAETIGTTADMADVACDSRRAYAVSKNGGLFVRDGAWTPLATGTTAALSAVTPLFGTQEVFAVGPAGAIVRCSIGVTPAVCTTENSGTTVDLFDVWADTFSGGVWAVGQRGTLLRRDTPTWRQLDTHGITQDLVSLSGYYDAASHVTYVAAAGRGNVVHIRTETDFRENAVLPEGNASSVWLPATSTLLVATGTSALWYRDGLFSALPFTARGGLKPVSADLNAVTSLGKGRILAVGDDGARVHRENGVWSADVFGVPVADDLVAVVTRSPGEIYAVGSRGTILVRRWGTWANEATGMTTEDLAAAVLDSERLWILGRTEILEKRFSTGAWTRHPLPEGTLPPSAMAVRLDAQGKATELTVAGPVGLLMSYDPNTGLFAAPLTATTTRDFRAVVYFAGDVYAGDNFGSIVRRAGPTVVDEYGSSEFHSVLSFVVDGSSLWATGEGGRMLRRVSGVWSLAEPLVTSFDLTGSTNDGESLYFVGTGGAILRRQ